VDFRIVLERRCENYSACGHMQNDVTPLFREDTLTGRSVLRGIDKADDRWRPWEDTWKKNNPVGEFGFLRQQLQPGFPGFLGFTIFELSIVAGASLGRWLVGHIDLFTAEYFRVVFL
jgi:hypothetical protein